MRKTRIWIAVLVAVVATIGALGLANYMPAPSRTVTVSPVSYNAGIAVKFHAPLSSMGAVAINHGGTPVPRGPDVPSPGTAAIHNPSLPEAGIRFLNDTSYMPQSEETIYADPANINHVVGGVNDGRYFFCGALAPADCPDGYTNSVTGFTVSADGGRSILKSDDLPGLNESVKAWNGTFVNEFMASWGDPSIAAGVHGEFFFATLLIDTFLVNGTTSSLANGIELSVSNASLFNPSVPCTTPLDDSAHNACWQSTMVAGNLTDNALSFEDKELISVDRDASSPFYGDVYVSWDHFNPNGTSESWVYRCTPALACTAVANGSNPLSGNDAFAAFTTPSVGSDGAVHFTWCNFGTFTSLGPITCEARSTAANGGALGAAHVVLSFDGAGTTLPAYNGLEGFATEQFRTASIPVIAADTSTVSNNLYFTVDACSAGNYYNFYGPIIPGNCGASSILFSRSTDGGSTWSTPAVLSTAGVNVQPWVATDPLNGAVVVAYYTTQFDPFNHRIDVVADVSNDEGVSFHQVRVTNISDEPNSDPVMYDYLAASGFGGSFVVPQFGDYLQVYALGGQLWASYTGNYAVEDGTFQTDPWLTLAPENAPLTVAASATPSPTDTGVSVGFHAMAANSAGTSTYAWAFGDGATGTGASPTHAYSATGTYTAQVTATDNLGRTATDTVSVTVTSALTAQLAATPTATDAGHAVAFAATPAGGTGTYTYSWAFGDGATSTSAAPSHAYAAAGTYTATVWVNDTGGASVMHTASIAVNAAPAATAAASPAATDVGRAVSLTATPSGGTAPFAYAWDFGDGSGSAVAAPSHTFATPGTYTVHVTATDAVGVGATATATVTVAALPTATATASTYTPAAGTGVTFTGATSGGTSPVTFAWTFGDGATSSSQSPSHSYAAAGTYTVHFWVNDSAGGSAVSTLTVVVSSPGALLDSGTATIYAIVALVVGLIVGALVMMALGRRRKGEKQGGTPPTE